MVIEMTSNRHLSF